MALVGTHLETDSQWMIKKRKKKNVLLFMIILQASIENIFNNIIIIPFLVGIMIKMIHHTVFQTFRSFDTELFLWNSYPKKKKTKKWKIIEAYNISDTAFALEMKYSCCKDPDNHWLCGSCESRSSRVTKLKEIRM